MTAAHGFVQLRHGILMVLAEQPVVGIQTLVARTERLFLHAAPDAALLGLYTTAIRDLLDEGRIVARRQGGTVEFHLPHSAPLPTPAPTPPARWWWRSVTSLVGAGSMMAVGCAFGPSPDIRSGNGLRQLPELRQVRVTPNGDVGFLPCNGCGFPTLKTTSGYGYYDDTSVAMSTPKPQQARMAEPLVPGAAATPGHRQVFVQTPPTLSVAELAKYTINFDLASSALEPQALRAVADIAPTALLAQEVKLRGYTDATGDPLINRGLAFARAYSVRKELVKRGVALTKMQISACSDCFIAPNDSEAGRRNNRRAEIELLPPRALAMK